MTEAWKSRVAAAFGTAADDYDRIGRVQWAVAHELARRLALAPLPEAPRVLEVGCGTGFLTASLLPCLPGARWLATDIAPEMVWACERRFAGRLHFEARVMDGEAPDLPPASFDLVCSSMAAQWFADLPDALAELWALVRPGGFLAVSTLGADTFAEWRAACAACGVAPATPIYPDAATYAAWMGEGAEVAETRHQAESSSSFTFLQDLKALGAHVSRKGVAPTPPGTLRRVMRQAGMRGFAATYHVLHGIRRKPL
ncbi:methyltransferase domain-containing protein [Novispirillum sp. DQ9]|uniref:methyltransferase domain-containing protein n=1 Tax=Novispirillum sp. DQ9 TaxID=3398612 RepID=UPI003C7D724C